MPTYSLHLCLCHLPFPFTWNRTIGPNARVVIHIEHPESLYRKFHRLIGLESEGHGNQMRTESFFNIFILSSLQAVPLLDDKPADAATCHSARKHRRHRKT
jgi:hypothetical protein